MRLRRSCGLRVLTWSALPLWGGLQESPEGRRPTDILPTARSVIVGGVHIIDSVCEDLPETRYEYTNQFYVLNGVLGVGSTKVARLLEDLGYRAIPIPAAYPRINKESDGSLFAQTRCRSGWAGRDWAEQSPHYSPVWGKGEVGFGDHGSAHHAGQTVPKVNLSGLPA